jgi:hypothetical protein
MTYRPQLSASSSSHILISLPPPLLMHAAHRRGSDDQKWEARQSVVARGRPPKIRAEWPMTAHTRGAKLACGAAAARPRWRRMLLSERDGRKKMMVTSGAHMSLRRKRKYNEIYVFVYTCSRARLVFIRIPWHIRGNSRITMANFKKKREQIMVFL